MNGFIYFAIIKALRNMLDKKQNLPAFTEQTDDNEIDLTFHLVMELWKPYFPWLHCNFDVIKPERNRRPDFIFHRSGVHDHNTLVVEVKRKSNAKVSKVNMKCKSDEDKIHNEWFIPDLSYHYGASVVIDEETSNFAFALFQNNPAEEKRFQFVNFQQNGFPDDTIIIPFINQFIAAKKANINANTNNLEQQIEGLVYQLYTQEYQ
jgi:hypothetical protein